jgi:hypothetical protein
MWFGVRKREVDLGDPIPEVRSFLGEVRLGQSESEAAEAAGVDEETLRRWKRDPAFREALRKAKTDGPPQVFWNLSDYTEHGVPAELGGDKHDWMKPGEPPPADPNAPAMFRRAQPSGLGEREAALASLSPAQRELLERELGRSSPGTGGSEWTIPPGGGWR